MGSRFLETIEITVPDRALLVVGFPAGCVAFASVVLADLTVLGKAAASLLVFATLVTELISRVLPRGRRNIRRALLLPDDSWRIFLGDADPMRAKLVRFWGAALGPVLALEWACPDGRFRQAWLLPGDVPAQVRRRLRVRLRLS